MNSCDADSGRLVYHAAREAGESKAGRLVVKIPGEDTIQHDLKALHIDPLLFSDLNCEHELDCQHQLKTEYQVYLFNPIGIG